jgi:glycosyltransferase involved in cell wall biosynthesis
VRVLHVIPTMSPSDGGPTAAVARMTDALAERGLGVTVATTHSRWAAGEAREAIVERFASAVTVETFPAWPLIEPRGFSPRMLGWLHRSVSRFDLVHLHSMFNWHSLAVPTVCRTHRISFVVRPLGTLDPWSRGQKSWKKQPYFDLIEKRNLGHAARIHVTSDAELRTVTDLGFGTKARCVPIGLDLHPVLPREPLGPRGMRILFLSRIHPKKNLPALLRALCDDQAFRHSPTLTIAGDGEPSYLLEMNRLVDALGIRDRVRFVGFVEGEAKRRIYCESDVFALPSFQENFGIAVAEAMAHGLPVVITPEVAIAPRVSATGAGTVSESTPAALAGALAAFEDPETWTRASVAARSLVASDFSADTMVEGLLAMYREIRPDLLRT